MVLVHSKDLFLADNICINCTDLILVAFLVALHPVD